MRLLIADLVGERLTREGLAALRDDVADLLARLDDAEASAETLPHRQRYLQLVTGFLRRLLELHLELVDEVERGLEEGEGPTFAEVAHLTADPAARAREAGAPEGPRSRRASLGPR